MGGKRNKARKGTQYPGRDDVEVRKCIFCGEHPLTEEHLFPDWFRTILPRDGKNHRWEHMFASHTGHESRVRENAPGDILHTKLKVVCENCNGGWMSDLQNRAKPIVAPLILGERALLDRDSAFTLASWFSMVTMVGEYIDLYKSKVTVPQEKRTGFMGNQAPFPNWLILIGHMDDPRHRLHRHNAAYIEPEFVPDGVDQGAQDRPNIQTTTFVVGHLFLYAIVKEPFITFDCCESDKVRNLSFAFFEPFFVPFGGNLSYLEAKRISSALIEPTP